MSGFCSALAAFLLALFWAFFLRFLSALGPLALPPPPPVEVSPAPPDPTDFLFCPRSCGYISARPGADRAWHSSVLTSHAYEPRNLSDRKSGSLMAVSKADLMSWPELMRSACFSRMHWS